MAAVSSFSSQLPVKIAFGDGVIAELAEALGCARGSVGSRRRRGAGRRASGRRRRAGRGRVERDRARARREGRRRADVRSLRTSSPSGCGLPGTRRSSGSVAARRSTSRRRRGSSPTRAGRRATTRTVASTPSPPTHRARPLPDDLGDRERGLGRERPHGYRGGRKIGFGHPNMRAQHALVDPVLTHGLPGRAHRALGRRCDGAGDRRVHRFRLVAALGGVRARGVPPRRAVAGGRGRGRGERRGPRRSSRARASRPVSR